MKTLQKQVSIIWRFRCESCRSKFEMTDEEKTENDREFDAWAERHADDVNYKPFNPGHKFNCPVCKQVKEVRRNEMHKFMVMDDGSEVQEY